MSDGASTAPARPPRLNAARRLVRGLGSLSPSVMSAVAEAWEEFSRSGRDVTMSSVRRRLTMSAFENALEARTAAERAARLAGLHGFAFAMAAWDAALAVSVGHEALRDDYSRLVRPLSCALPWLL